MPFDPSRPCGTSKRGAGSYRRAELDDVAKEFGIDNPKKFNMDELCLRLTKMIAEALGIDTKGKSREDLQKEIKTSEGSLGIQVKNMSLAEIKAAGGAPAPKKEAAPKKAEARKEEKEAEKEAEKKIKEVAKKAEKKIEKAKTVAAAKKEEKEAEKEIRAEEKKGKKEIKEAAKKGEISPKREERKLEKVAKEAIAEVKEKEKEKEKEVKKPVISPKKGAKKPEKKPEKKGVPGLEEEVEVGGEETVPSKVAKPPPQERKTPSAAEKRERIKRCLMEGKASAVSPRTRTKET